MLSSTLKRSLATLGVVAGLLAAAGPANAGGPGGDLTLRERAHVTLIDYDGTPIVTYSLKDGPQGDDGF
jgi:hypothetical protein